MSTRHLVPAVLEFLVLGLGGCAVGPDYHPPGVETPSAWSEAQPGGETRAAAGVTEWWKTFHDPELDSLIARSVESNHDLRVAEARLREARALRSGAFWDFGPTITGSAGYADQQRSKNAQSFTGTIQRLHTDLYDAHFDASWEIDLFGGKRRALESATAQYAAVEEDRRAVLVSVLAEVAQNYLDLRGFQQRLVIARNNLQAQQDVVGLTRARFNAGLTSELDVNQAEALLATTQSQLPTLETSLKEAVHRLGVLLGREPGALAGELSTESSIPATPPTVPVGLPSDLLRRRPDVRSAERLLAAATAGIGVETAELFPKFVLVGTAGLQSFSASDWFSGGSRYWSAGPTVTWRLLDFGRIRARIKAAGARQEQALAAYERTVLTSFEEVENALVAGDQERVRHASLADSVAANRRALELANELYQKGLGSFLNVLDAERSLYQAEDQLVDSEHVVTVDLVALYKALGGGWEPFTTAGGAPPATAS